MTDILSDIALLLPGLWTTLQLTALSLLVGLPLALAVAVLLRSHRRLITWPAITLIEILRGMPALVLLYFVYYGFPSIGLVLDNTLSISIAFGLTFVAYTAPILSASIAMVPPEHIEAARALGLSRWVTTTRVVLPQAVQAAKPPLISWTVILFQGTALASVVGATDLFARATSLGAQQFTYTYWIVLAALLYALPSIPLLALAAAMQNRTGGRGLRHRLKSLTRSPHAAATPTLSDAMPPRSTAPSSER
jgi:polar amino acid transport system permease protein